MHCTKCGLKNDADSKYCIRCGLYLAKIIYCTACGTQMRRNQKSCPSCGVENPVYDPTQSTITNKVLATERTVSSIMLPIGIAFAVIGLLIVFGLLLVLFILM